MSRAWERDELAGEQRSPTVVGRRGRIAVSPFEDGLGELEAGIVSLLSIMLALVGIAGHQVVDEAVDGIGDARGAFDGHGCIVPPQGLVARIGD